MAAGVRNPPGSSETRTPARRILLVALPAALLWCAVVLVVHRVSPRTWVSAHGLLHGAIAVHYAQAEDPTFPPDNPFYAGEKLPYYWFFQYLGARLMLGLGLDPLHALELLVLLATFTVVLAGAPLGLRLHGSRAAALGVSFLVFAGCHPQGWVVLLLRGLRHGAEVFRDDPDYLWGLVHPINQQMRLWDPWCMNGPLFNFFLNITARPLGMAMLVVTLGFLWSAWRSPGLWRLVLLGISTAALGALSSIVAMGLAGALSGALVLQGLSPRERAVVPWSRRAGMLLAVWLGLLASSFTFHHLFGAGEVSLKSLGGMLSTARGLLAAMWLLVLLAAAAWLRARPTVRGFLAVNLLVAAALVGAAVVFELPRGNQDNWYHAALVVLAVVGAGFLAREERGELTGRARWRAALVLLAFLPTLGILLFSYTGREKVPLGAAGGWLVRTPEWSDEAALYLFLRQQTEPESVLVMDPDSVLARCAGNTMELPALSGRALLTERDSHYLASPFADCADRVALARTLATGGSDLAREKAILGSLARPIYVVTHAEELTDAASMTARHGPPVFESGPIAVFRLRGSGS